MKNPARWLIALALCACALVWWWGIPPPEPSYHGMLLSSWMRLRTQFTEPGLQIPTPGLRSLGAPAVEWLAHKAEYGRPKGARPWFLAKLLAQIPWRKHRPEWPAEYDERVFAMELLGKMGAQAKPAIPVLLRVLDSDIQDESDAAAEALNRIGPASWPAVEERLAHGSTRVRGGLLETMWVRVDAQADPVSAAETTRVLALLVGALQDRVVDIRDSAAKSIGKAIYPDKGLPGLLADQSAMALWLLPSQQAKAVREAEGRVIKYYRNAKAEAVPRLTALLTDPDEAKRHFARAMLDQLATH